MNIGKWDWRHLIVFYYFHWESKNKSFSAKFWICYFLEAIKKDYKTKVCWSSCSKIPFHYVLALGCFLVMRNSRGIPFFSFCWALQIIPEWPPWKLHRVKGRTHADSGRHFPRVKSLDWFHLNDFVSFLASHFPVFQHLIAFAGQSCVRGSRWLQENDDDWNQTLEDLDVTSDV
jgi:hypothetical protein